MDIRRATTTRGSDKIIVVDSGCDQCVAPTSCCRVLKYHNTMYSVRGAFDSDSKARIMRIVDVATWVQFDDEKVMMRVNQCLLDTDEESDEFLLQPHQLRDHGVVVDDVSTKHLGPNGEYGKQSIVAGNVTYPLKFDGWKMYMICDKPTPEEADEVVDGKIKPIVLTSPRTYNPAKRVRTRRVKQTKKNDLRRWAKNLGCTTRHNVEHTLIATSQHVVEDPSQTRTIMRDHYVARLLPLRPHRISDTCYTDTFFSSVKSVRGYKCFQLFSLQECKFDTTYLMKAKSQAIDALGDFVRYYGAPNLLVHDGAKEMKSNKWLDFVRRYAIPEHPSEPYHQNQNLAERRGGDIKTGLWFLLLECKAPVIYWCYALTFLVYCRQYIARRSLQYRTPYEFLFGETPDISVFRFPFYSKVWYYSPTVRSPKSKMLRGRFLGVAETCGDVFTYVILPVDESERPATRHSTLLRSCVRGRIDEEDAPVVLSKGSTLELYNSNGEVLKEEYFLTPTRKSQAVYEKEFNDKETRKDSSPESLKIGSVPPPEEIDRAAQETGVPPDAGTDVGVNVDNTQTDELEHNNHEPQQEETNGNPESSEFDETVRADIEKSLYGAYNSKEGDDCDLVQEIISHSWKDGELMMTIVTNDGQRLPVPYRIMQCDAPALLSTYILENGVDSGVVNPSLRRYTRWARHYRRSVRKLTRRLSILARRLTMDDEKRIQNARSPKRKTSKGRNDRHIGMRYGVIVPRSTKEALEIDKITESNLWREAIEREISQLIDRGCFEFRAPGHDPGANYQNAPLRMIYEVKQDGRRKARLVAGGHKVEVDGIPVKATVVKSVSIRTLHVIRARDNLGLITGDIANAFINADTREKVYCTAGLEFGDKFGSTIIIKKALYGLKSSANAWHGMLSDFIRTLGFKPTRYDEDVWIRRREDGEGYDYVCTHVDDFMIVAREPQRWLEPLQKQFVIKQAGRPSSYLGNDLVFDEQSGMYRMGCATYLKEALTRIEKIFGEIRKQKSPMSDKARPEIDDSPLLSVEDHRTYQMLIGVAQWLVCCGRMDVNHAVTSLSRFNAAPREGHLEMLLRVFGYLKKFRNKWIQFNPGKFKVEKANILQADFLEKYSDATEDVEPGLPEPLGTPMQTSICTDSDHAHDVVTRRSITGVLVYVGLTPVSSVSRRQTAIASSTYEAEFMAMRTATQEAKVIRNLLRSFGIPLDGPTLLFGDSLGVIQQASFVDADLSKKHVAISYHLVRESIAAGIILPYWIGTEDNLADILTKPLAPTAFIKLCHEIYWKEKDGIDEENCQDR